MTDLMERLGNNPNERRKVCVFISWYVMSLMRDNDNSQHRNARRTRVGLPQMTTGYSRTSSLQEYQVSQRHGARMQVVTSENFSTTSTLPQMRMERRSSIGIARSARMYCHYFTLRKRPISVMHSQKKRPCVSYCPAQYNAASSYGVCP